jgi:hypothetical protein
MFGSTLSVYFHWLHIRYLSISFPSFLVYCFLFVGFCLQFMQHLICSTFVNTETVYVFLSIEHLHDLY